MGPNGDIGNPVVKSSEQARFVYGMENAGVIDKAQSVSNIGLVVGLDASQGVGDVHC